MLLVRGLLLNEVIIFCKVNSMYGGVVEVQCRCVQFVNILLVRYKCYYYIGYLCYYLINLVNLLVMVWVVGLNNLVCKLFISFKCGGLVVVWLNDIFLYKYFLF